MIWYVYVDGQQTGPLSENELRMWAKTGRLKRADLVWRSGMPEWLPIEQTPEFAQQMAATGRSQSKPIGEDRLMRAILPVGRSGWAIAAGYLGLFSVLFVPAPFSLATGLLAVREIRSNPKKHGMGRAIFGIIMGAVFTVLLVWVIVKRLK